MPAANASVKSVQIDGRRTGVNGHWARLLKRTQEAFRRVSLFLLDVSESGPSTSRLPQHRRGGSEPHFTGADQVEEEVEQIVVDNVLLHSGLPGSISHSDHKTNPEVTYSTKDDAHTDTQVTNVEETIWEKFRVLTIIRWRVWPIFESFFRSTFIDPATEENYDQELWARSKTLAFWASAFLVLNWVLANIVVHHPLNLADIIFYYGLSLVTTLVLPFLVIFDFPRKRPCLYQIILAVQIWQWAIDTTIFMYLCGFFNSKHEIFDCEGKSFLGFFYNALALPTIGLFALRMSRLSTAIGATVTFIVPTVLILPDYHTWVRQILHFIPFHVFILYIHFKLEASDRRLFGLREQLKVQCDATQKLEISEKRASDSKRRLTSYIFHEVRVPLNTALLAVQNIESGRVLDQESDEDVEFGTLDWSLSMMSKVLNDVLDFNRLDAGKFESAPKAYNFPAVLRSMLIPLQLESTTRQLTFTADLDSNVNLVTRRSYYTALGHSPQEVDKMMDRYADSDCAFVLGDEIRLRQVITNLTSNAAKFTPVGGCVKVVTKLIWPKLPTPSNETHARKGESEMTGFSSDELHKHDLARAAFDHIVIRFEIHDTGVGIKARDLVDRKLFSPYVQTEIGNLQGGKGTGLGLALVRRIIKLSGGRLGVKSKPGAGSTFWFELNMGVGKKVLNDQMRSGTPVANASESAGPTHEDEDCDCFAVEDKPQQTPMPAEGVGNEGETLSSTSSAGISPPTQIQDQRTPFAFPLLRGVEHAERDGSASRCSQASHYHTPTSTPYPASSSEVQLDQSAPLHPMEAMSFSPNPNVSRHPLHCLVVDDDPLTRLLMSRMLGRIGCVVDTAENGQIALEKIVTFEETVHTSAESMYDVVFLDNQMPIMTGLEVVSQLRDAGRRDFVVGVTGNALLSDQEEYTEAGADHVLTKPVLERSLKAMLALASERKKTGTL